MANSEKLMIGDCVTRGYSTYKIVSAPVRISHAPNARQKVGIADTFDRKVSHVLMEELAALKTHGGNFRVEMRFYCMERPIYRQDDLSEEEKEITIDGKDFTHVVKDGVYVGFCNLKNKPAYSEFANKKYAYSNIITGFLVSPITEGFNVKVDYGNQIFVITSITGKRARSEDLCLIIDNKLKYIKMVSSDKKYNFTLTYVSLKDLNILKYGDHQVQFNLLCDVFTLPLVDALERIIIFLSTFKVNLSKFIRNNLEHVRCILDILEKERCPSTLIEK